MLKENKTVKTEIDMRIFFFHINTTFRSSCLEMFFLKVVLKDFLIFTRKHLFYSTSPVAASVP